MNEIYSLIKVVIKSKYLYRISSLLTKKLNKFVTVSANWQINWTDKEGECNVGVVFKDHANFSDASVTDNDVCLFDEQVLAKCNEELSLDSWCR